MNTQTSSYEQQAIEFLNATSTAFTCKFKEHTLATDSTIGLTPNGSTEQQEELMQSQR